MSLSDLGQCLRVLGGATDVNLILMHFDLEAGRKERVEPYDKVRVTFKEVRHTADHSRSVNAVGEVHTCLYMYTKYKSLDGGNWLASLSILQTEDYYTNSCII